MKRIIKLNNDDLIRVIGGATATLGGGGGTVISEPATTPTDTSSPFDFLGDFFNSISSLTLGDVFSEATSFFQYLSDEGFWDLAFWNDIF